MVKYSSSIFGLYFLLMRKFHKYALAIIKEHKNLKPGYRDITTIKVTVTREGGDCDG